MITIELSPEQETVLRQYCQTTRQTPAEVMTQLLNQLLQQTQPPTFPNRKPSLCEHPGFGIWQKKQIDAVYYQQQLREEWD